MERKYEIPDLTDLQVAFGFIGHLPRYADLDEEFRRERAPECKAVSALFFDGGTFADHGFKVRDGLDRTKVHRAIRAALGSWEPKHEHKIAGVGALVRDWFEREQPSHD